MEQKEINKLIMYVIHEHNSGLGLAGTYVNLAKNALRKGDLDKVKEYLDKIYDVGLTRQREAVDYLYTKGYKK
jgi:ATP/maltotriose-dependent transcriptional regulator MalT